MRSNYSDLTGLYHRLLIAKPMRFRATFSETNDREHVGRDYSEAKICQDRKILAIQI